MTIEEILRQLDSERNFGSRFPVRVIFTERLSQYNELVSKLSFSCNMTLNLADYCGNGDVVPKFDKIKATIDIARDQHVLLLSVSEYLRICIKREVQVEKSQLTSLWAMMQGTSSKTRIILPLFAARELFEKVIPTVDERQQPYLWSIDPPIENTYDYSLTIYSSQFRGIINGSIDGLGDWLRYWPVCYTRGNQSLITGLYQNAENILGNISIKVIDNPFDYITSIAIDTQKLKKEWGSDAFWASLIPDIKTGVSFNETIENALNVKSFDIVSILAKWNFLTHKQKWLTWTWYQINDSNDYFSYVFHHLSSLDNITYAMRDFIFSLDFRKDEWVQQRMSAIDALSISGCSDKLDSITLLETRLKLLNYKFHEDCVYAVKTISLWLRKGASFEAIESVLNDRFPQLVAYLSPNAAFSSSIDTYFNWYRKAKIINRFPDTPAPFIDLESFDSRYSRMRKYVVQDSFAFWIDGMGVEWLPLLLNALCELHLDAKIKSEVVSAALPTETEYNKQWIDDAIPYEKWNKLDSLSHKGMMDDKDYYSCIVYQMSVIMEVAKQISVYLETYSNVIITGDHGSSRLAALSFHDKTKGIEPPGKAIVHSHGRFCTLSNTVGPLPYQRYFKRSDTEFLVMAGYEHFVQSGNAAGGNDDDHAIVGEIHGGMTPEEYLVPIVIVSRNKALSSIEYNAVETSVFRSGSKTNIVLCFNCEVTTLEVSAGIHEGRCDMQSPTTWLVTFNGISENLLILKVIANDKYLTKQLNITVKTKGIIKNDDPLGGL